MPKIPLEINTAMLAEKINVLQDRCGRYEHALAAEMAAHLKTPSLLKTLVRFVKNLEIEGALDAGTIPRRIEIYLDTLKTKTAHPPTESTGPQTNQATDQSPET